MHRYTINQLEEIAENIMMELDTLNPPPNLTERQIIVVLINSFLQAESSLKWLENELRGKNP